MWREEPEAVTCDVGKATGSRRNRCSAEVVGLSANGARVAAAERHEPTSYYQTWKSFDLTPAGR
jgi:hypothetical protein